MNKYKFTFQYTNKFGEAAEIMLSGIFNADSKEKAERITNEICEVYKKNELVELYRGCSISIELR